MKLLEYVGVGLVIGVGVGVAALASQTPQSQSPDIKSFGDAEAAIHELTLRVASLESRLESMEGSDASVKPTAAPSLGAAVLKVESIETITPTEETQQEAKALIIEAEGLERQAETFEASAAGITIDSGQGVTDTARSSARKQISSFKSQAGDARRQAKQKRKQAEAMVAPRQIIRGWSGKKTVEARTEKDLSSQLRNVAVGSFITATWTLVDMDDTTATVNVTSVRSVAAPAGFVERPAGSR
jgi:hypothetical protein